MSERQTAMAEILIRHKQLGDNAPDLNEMTVSEAARSDHPLHDVFQWDDSKAAHQYRLAQSRTMWLNFDYRQCEPVVRKDFILTYGDVAAIGPQIGSSRDDYGMCFIPDRDPFLTLRHLTGEVPCSTSIPGLLTHCRDVLEANGLEGCVKDLEKVSARVKRFLSSRVDDRAA